MNVPIIPLIILIVLAEFGVISILKWIRRRKDRDQRIITRVGQSKWGGR